MASRKLTDIIRDVEDKLDNFQTVFLTKVAETAVNASPVDTGAYVLSMNFSTGRDSRKRQKSSSGRDKMDEAAAKGEALQNLAGDIAGLPKDSKVYLNNRSPHAGAVENGGPNWVNTGPYKVFAKVSMSVPRLVEEALNEVKGK